VSSGGRRRIRAEQAFLGSVLSDPAGQGYLLDLVSPDDMARPYHGQVLAAMQRLRARGVAPGTLAVYEEVKKDPELPRGVSHDGVLLAGLMEAAPRPAHAPAYAGIVAGSGIRQRIALAGSRLMQAAEGQDLETALAIAARARQEVGRCQARWEALRGPVQQELASGAHGAGGWDDTARLLADVRAEIGRLRQDLLAGAREGFGARLASVTRQVADVTAACAEWHERQARSQAARAWPGRAEAEEAGARAVRDLAASPAHIADVRDWLRPGDFARPAHGELYAVMRDLAGAGQPVDPVTVAWEASRRGIDADAGDLDGGMGPLAVASAWEVHRRGLLAQLARAGHHIEMSAADHRLSPRQLMRSAGERLSCLEPGRGPESETMAGSRSGGGLVAGEQGAEAEAGAA